MSSFFTGSPKLSDLQILLSKSFTLPLLAYVSYLLFKDDSKPKSTLNNNSSSLSSSKKKKILESDEEKSSLNYDYSKMNVNPVDSSFKWQDTPPFKYRPFKNGEYKLVMGIQNIPLDEWLMVENTYLDYTNIKNGYVKDPNIVDHVIYLNDDCIDAAKEFYEASTQFMLKRYPQYFQIETKEDNIQYIHNLIRDDYIELNPEDVKPVKRLMTNLTQLLEEDVVILFPDPENYDTDEYILKGACFTFAAGFDPTTVFNTPLSNLHRPVPDYRTKLKSQMNKFFEKVKPGVLVRRHNWSIQTDNRLLILSGSKGKEGEATKSVNSNDLDFGREVFFRSERQTLTKLHRSKAMIFTIRAYLTSLRDIRDEGLGDQLVGGINGMQEILGIYKNRPKWGDAATDFLTYKTEGADKPWIKGFV
ncbi:hypothetical protein WICMUC_003179 [Wickerhamomyces mucosus]|uniref:Uncharacterized protein n=1 Tax=Wickerhamomyces mucosus TaxID=1378264 RepID=A0A9P8PM29_9ASCO|nr:hypothetical protein WICMUC_003179 [Wickerhamomyces mucosus]